MLENKILKTVLSFFILISLQALLSFLCYNFFDNKEKFSSIVQACIDVSFSIMIVCLVKIWKINISGLFRKVNIYTVGLLFIMAVCIAVLYPILNYKLILSSISEKSIPITNINTYFFEDIPGNSYFLIRSLIVVPFLEEIFYRGILLTELRKKYSSVVSIGITSLLFSIGHIDIDNFIPALVIGFLLGLIFDKTKNLLLVMILHHLLNVLFIFSKDISCKMDEYFILLIFAYLFLIYLIWKITIKIINLNTCK